MRGRSTVRPSCEPLEERLTPAVFNIADHDVAALIAAIKTANANGEDDTINLAPGSRYILTAADSDSGAGLPGITADGGKALLINGNGSAIERAPGAPPFRIFDVRGGNLTLDRVIIANGYVNVIASGILVQFGGSLLLSNSAVVNSTASQGGGIFVVSSTATIINSTISGNSAGRGGGITVVGSQVAILNSTVARNSATLAGGGILLTSTSTLTVESTIIGDNAAPDGADLFLSSGTVNATRSLIESPQAGAINGTNVANIVGQDPRLGPLQDNGGPTPTHALLAGSPALDQGSNPLFLPFDQRGPGFARVKGAAPDIGAFEADPSTPGATPVLAPAASPGALPQPFFFLLPPKARKGKSHRGVREQQMILANSFAGPLRGRTLLSLNGLAGLQLLGASLPLFQAVPLGGNQLLIDFGPDGLPAGAAISLVLTFGKPDNGVLFVPRLTSLG
jgi:hypothetical protein